MLKDLGVKPVKVVREARGSGIIYCYCLLVAEQFVVTENVHDHVDTLISRRQRYHTSEFLNASCSQVLFVGIGQHDAFTVC